MQASTSGATKGSVLIVGAGPAGALMALYLAEQGWQVDVYDKLQPQARADPAGAAAPLGRPAPLVVGSVGPRSYNIVLTLRALEALQAAGVQLGEDEAVSLQHSIRHRGKGKLRAGPAMGETVAVNRGILAGRLVAEAQRRWPGRITFHWGWRLAGLDLPQRTAQLESASDAKGRTRTERLRYDLLVGADGVSSKVREVLASALPDLAVAVERDDMEFKAVDMPHASALAPDLRPPGARPERAFHSWFDKRSNATLLASPAVDGHLQGVFILPAGVHATLTNAAQYQEFITTAFPDIKPLPAFEMADRLVGAPVSFGGTTVKCSRFHGPGVVLLGDAAHSVWPSLGQGCNAALESCAVLARCLAPVSQPGQVDQALAAFTEARRDDVHAIADMSQAGFGGTKQRALTFNLFFAQLVVRMLLSKLLPWLVKPPAMMEINRGTTPYAEIQRRQQQEMRTFKTALSVVGALVAALALRAVVPALRAWA